MSDEKSQNDQESQEPEPTMEEILASIRRIIADDDQSNAKAASGEGADANEAPASGEEEEDPGDDVLDLIEKVDDPVDSKDEDGEPSPIEEPQAELEPEAEAQDAASAGEEEVVLEDAGEEAPSDEQPDQPEPDEEPAEAEPASPGDEESIISAAAAAAASGTFAELAKAMDREPETVGNLALGSGNSLEDLVKEMVRPMLKEWLDQNLPALVKHLVRKEIQRMVSRAEDI